VSETEIPATELARAQAAPPPPPPAPINAGEAAATPAAPAPPAGEPAAAGATTAAPSPPPVPAEETAAVPAAQQKIMDQNWPFKGYDGPQPWEAENTPELTVNRLMISPGAAGPEVAELADYLARLGYSSSIAHGQNPTNAYDDTVAAAVRAFCSEYGVEEDPAVIRARTPDTVGAWIWEALTRAVYKRAAEEEQQG